MNLLRGAALVHLDPPRVERADLRLAQGRIVERGPRLERRPGEELHDLSGLWVMPGLVCAHTHLYSALATGMPLPEAPPTSFADMLSKVWWRMDRALDAASIAACARVGGLAALRAGVTTLVDHHASPNAIEGSLEILDAGLEELGLRRVLCYEVTDRGGAERARAGLQAHRGLLRAGSAGGMRAALIGGHASFTLSDETLRSMVRLAEEHAVGLHVHVAEAADDATLTGEPVVPRLARLGALRPGSIFAHGVHLEASDLHRVEDAGAWLTHQPRSNQNNGVGYAPVCRFGRNVALGTDGIGADMIAELQAAYFQSQEARTGLAPGRWLGVLATGARLAGGALGVRLGCLERGAEADLVVLDPPPGPPVRADNVAATLLYRLSSSAVRHVMVGGRWRLLDREPVGLDPRSLSLEAETQAEALWARMNTLPPLP